MHLCNDQNKLAKKKKKNKKNQFSSLCDIYCESDESSYQSPGYRIC